MNWEQAYDLVDELRRKTEDPKLDMALGRALEAIQTAAEEEDRERAERRRIEEEWEQEASALEQARSEYRWAVGRIR